MEKEQVYPTETIDLPSKGLFYPKDHPLRSGQIELHYMTAKHEDILTSTNLIQKGIVLDKLMDSLIATKGVKSSDLLLGDLNAVMVASRILGYGKDYAVNINCPKCGSAINQVVDLSTLETENELNDESSSEFEITLPISGAKIILKLLTRGDELALEKEVESLKKATGNTSTNTARLRSMIKSVDGDSSAGKIWSFVDSMLVRDARFLREQYRKHVPDVNFTIDVECSCVSDEKKVRLPIGINFFWPDFGV